MKKYFLILCCGSFFFLYEANIACKMTYKFYYNTAGFFDIFKSKKQKKREQKIQKKHQSAPDYSVGISSISKWYQDSAEEFTPFINTAFEGEPSYVQNHNISMATGQHTEIKTLLLAPGKESIVLNLGFSSENRGMGIGGNWNVLPHLYLMSFRGSFKRYSLYVLVFLYDSDGRLLKYNNNFMRRHKNWVKHFKPCMLHSMSNTSTVSLKC